MSSRTLDSESCFYRSMSYWYNWTLYIYIYRKFLFLFISDCLGVKVDCPPSKPRPRLRRSQTFLQDDCLAKQMAPHSPSREKCPLSNPRSSFLRGRERWQSLKLWTNSNRCFLPISSVRFAPQRHRTPPKRFQLKTHFSRKNKEDLDTRQMIAPKASSMYGSYSSYCIPRVPSLHLCSSWVPY